MELIDQDGFLEDMLVLYDTTLPIHKAISFFSSSLLAFNAASQGLPLSAVLDRVIDHQEHKDQKTSLLEFRKFMGDCRAAMKGCKPGFEGSYKQVFQEVKGLRRNARKVRNYARKIQPKIVKNLTDAVSEDIELSARKLQILTHLTVESGVLAQAFEEINAKSIFQKIRPALQRAAHREEKNFDNLVYFIGAINRDYVPFSA